jgi:hypothetical protein
MVVIMLRRSSTSTPIQPSPALGRGLFLCSLTRHSLVRETPSGIGTGALAPSTGARGRWGFHRNPLCEPIRFLGRDRCLYPSSCYEDTNAAAYLGSGRMSLVVAHPGHCWRLVRQNDRVL